MLGAFAPPPFSIAAQRAQRDIQDAISLSAPRQQPQMQQPMARPQMPMPQMQQPAQQFQEGGLATSLRPDPINHDRDVEFVNTRNLHMRDMVGKPQHFAKGGLAMAEGGTWTRKEGKDPSGA